MKSLRSILAIDIGAGTQDILLYDATCNPENCTTLILPTPTRYFAHEIEKCVQDLFIEGNAIGGGSIPALLKKHIEKGYRVYMTEEAAYTVRNSLQEVQQSGINLVKGREAISNFKGVTLRFQEIDLRLLKDFLKRCGEELAPDLVAIAVQDHGVPLEGMSNREWRFRIIEQRLKEDSRPESFIYSPGEIPDCFKRMRAVASTAKNQMNVEVVVMDTALAAILGCRGESTAPFFVNVGNNHTLVAVIKEGRIEGLMEHHTGMLGKEKLESLIVRFIQGAVTSKEILNDGGHGAIILKPPTSKAGEIIVTGPRREMLRGSRLNVRFAAPYGNMMLTGPFGLVRGAHLKYGIHW